MLTCVWLSGTAAWCCSEPQGNKYLTVGMYSSALSDSVKLSFGE